MVLTHYQVGAIIAGSAGTLLIIIIVIPMFIHPVRRSTFSRPKSLRSVSKSTIKDVESQRLSTPGSRVSEISRFETIGNLVISPSHRPLPSALDIINRGAMSVILPAGAKVASLKDDIRTETREVVHDARRTITMLHQASFAQCGAVAAQEPKDEAKVHVTSVRLDFDIPPGNQGFNLNFDFTPCLFGQPENARDVFVISDDTDDEPGDVSFAVHEKTTHNFGSGEGMSAFYHAV